MFMYFLILFSAGISLVHILFTFFLLLPIAFIIVLFVPCLMVDQCLPS